MRSIDVPKNSDDGRLGLSDNLAREVDEATSTLNACLRDLEEVLARPVLEASALTSVRLRLAGVRLTHGPWISRLSDFLAGRVTESEQSALNDLRTSHQRILQSATAHTAKWTLDAIQRDWQNYRRETRALVRRWQLKSDQDAKLIYPLIKKAAAR